MVRTTPFHPRLVELNDQHLYTHWQGTLSPLRYGHAPKHEYFAVRNSVGIFDTSPLFTYRITGPDAERLLARILVRDLAACPPGRAAYTLWCDERGFVMEDGVVFHTGEQEFRLTSARPAYSWLADHRFGLRARIEDISDQFGILAVQGPRSARVLAALVPGVVGLPWFGILEAAIDGVPVTVSRTGYTGDLGYEIAVPAESALGVLDAVLAAGRGHGLRPFGEEAMDLLRIEAGLPLVDVEWHDSRTAWSDEERVTPSELGMGWMLRGVRDGDRRFVGSEAIRRELIDGGSRWTSVGVVVDWADWDRLHREAGLIPAKSERVLGWESWLRAADDETQVGHVTSLAYSPLLQRHVGLAKIRPDLASPGTDVRLETTIHHRTTTVAARVAALPFFDPARKRGAVT